MASEPDFELRRRIARAIGCEWHDEELLSTGWRMEGWHHPDGWCYRTLPEFEEDLRAAFSAAIKVGLFTTGKHILGCSANGEWFVNDSEYNEVGHAEHPALAICMAILKLKEK